MRATRAYLASLGTTGLLVLSSVLVLVIGSTFVAFNGWPGDSNGDEPESVLVQAVPVEPGPGEGPAGIAENAAPAAEAVAAAAPTPAVQAPAASSPDGGDGGDGAPTPPGDGGGTPPGDGGGGPPDPTDTIQPTDPEPPGGGGGIPLPGGGYLLPNGDVSLTDGAADGLESTTTYLGQQVVGQLSPDLGTLLTQAGQGLTDLIRALDGTPPPPRGR